jgi:dynein heavy chain
LKVV